MKDVKILFDEMTFHHTYILIYYFTIVLTIINKAYLIEYEQFDDIIDDKQIG